MRFYFKRDINTLGLTGSTGVRCRVSQIRVLLAIGRSEGKEEEEQGRGRQGMGD